MPVDTQNNADEAFLSLEISGRLDAMTAPTAEAELARAVDAGDGRLVLDLSGLDYISSAGLRILLTPAKRVARAEGRLVLFGLQPQVREVLEISGLLPIFKVAADASAAASLMEA